MAERARRSAENGNRIEGGERMQTKTAIGLAAVFTAGIALFPMSAQAVCQQVIYADRAYTDQTQVQILGRVASTDEFAYFANTTNTLVANLIVAAVAQRNRVFIVGNAQSCPTTGALRNVGTILEIYQ